VARLAPQAARGHIRNMQSRSELPTAYLGTMTFGWSQASSPVDDAVAKQFIETCAAHGFTEIDTARIYSGGESEVILGRVLQAMPDTSKLTVTTKAHPSQAGGLSPTGLREQVAASMAALQVNSLNGLYLHQPDTENPLSDTLREADAMVKEGLIREIGMSNYSAPETARTMELCTANNWTKPACFQALYNPLNRRIEAELLPILRANGVRLVAYNPLAAGLLTGKHQPDAVPAGRFKENVNYLDRFFKDDCFQGIEIIRKACDAAGLTMLQATFSWLMHHSALGAGDAILLGASNPDHLTANIAAIEASQPLPEAVVQAFEEAWAVCTDEAFYYWRGYSSDQPDRENMHAGASYVVKK